jgi:ElaB/YqjD/DUF883 family membrane-anchored ribosome-binding protein
MGEKPKNFTEAIDALEGHHDNGSGQENRGDDIRARLEQELRRIETLLKNVKPQLDEVTNRVSDEAKKAKVRVEDQVVKNPWAALGIVGLVFFVLGFLFGFTGSRSRD